MYKLLGKLMGITPDETDDDISDTDIEFESEPTATEPTATEPTATEPAATEPEILVDSEPEILFESEPEILVDSEPEIQFGSSQEELYNQLLENSEELYAQLQKVIHGKDANDAAGKIVGSVRDHVIEQLPTISSSTELNEMFQAITEEIYPQIQDFCEELRDYGIEARYTGQMICDAME
jgi:hypothetical protein